MIAIKSENFDSVLKYFISLCLQINVIIHLKMQAYRDSLALLKKHTLKSALMFLALLIVVCLILYPPAVREKVIGPFVVIICNQAAWLINLFGLEVHAHNTNIVGSGFSVDIKNGCNAVYEISLFLCAVFVYPSGVKYKLLGMAVGSLIIYSFNLLRVVSLFLVGVYHKELFNMVHNHV
jgi:exosortase/archaeosortase family protein